MDNTKVSMADDYFRRDKLVKKSGYNEYEFHKGLFKELVDNAMDAIESSGEETGTITIEFDNQSLLVSDSAADFNMQSIDQVLMDMDNYISTNNQYKKVSRGSQGNALKSILGICYVDDYVLNIISNYQIFSYTPKKVAGDMIINKSPGQAVAVRKGVLIQGLHNNLFDDFNEQVITDYVFQYQLYNHHITFVINGVQYPNTGTYNNRIIDKHFVHYYTDSEFTDLINGVLKYDTSKTVKSFLENFSGCSRSNINKIVPADFPKYLRELTDENCGKLYFAIRHHTKADKDRTITNRYSIDAATVNKQINSYYHKDFDLLQEKKILLKDMKHGYVFVQGFFFYHPNKTNNMIFLNSINKSISINDDNIICELYPTDTVQSYIDKTKKVAGDFIVYLNYISPNFTYTDYDKSRLDIWQYTTEITQLYKSLLLKATRHYNSAIMIHRKNVNHQYKLLMEKYFDEAFEKAKGSLSYVMARQVFYSLREIININEGKELSSNSHNTLTQSVITEFQKKDSKYLAIYFERRGYIYDYFNDRETPISTKHVHQIKSTRAYSNQISERSITNYNFDDYLLYNKILFIEKQGFTDLIKESGIPKEYNLKLASSQGYVTRAGAEWVEYMISKGMDVYVLHDCDLHGYNIFYNLKHPSKTFTKALDVKSIGISVDDVKAYNKPFELSESKKQYKNVLNRLSKKEQDFFLTNKAKVYKRCEINSFTNDELIAFIKDKLTPKRIIPEADVINNCIKKDDKEIIKELLYRAYIESGGIDIPRLIDTNDMLNSIQDQKDQHWLDVVINGYREKKEEWINKMFKNVNIEIKR